jgi:hypothetical protein
MASLSIERHPWGCGWMGWRDWFKRREDRRMREWREAWTEAVKTPDAERAQQLRARLDSLALTEDESEMEREMLEGLDALVELSVTLGRNGPPVVETGHRAVGAELCYFSAPASLPDDPGQPSGTLLLTKTRAVFVGGGRAMTIPWHSVGRCLQQHRDVLLVRTDRDDLQRLRCNSFTDTLRAACLARHLARRRV